MSPDESAPPSKSQRANRKNMDTHECANPTRSRFWFNDGNIVLQAQDVQFRVHSSVLSLHSNVFKDMFELPQPTHSEEVIVDGCSVVSLSDSSSELEIVLSVIYDNIRTLGLYDSVTYAEIAAMLRIGRKYEIDHLQQCAADVLCRQFPTTLFRWDRNRHENYFRFTIDEYIRTIDLLTEFALYSALPGAYLTVLHNFDLDDLLGQSGQSPTAFVDCIKGREMIILWLNQLHLSWSRKVVEPGFSPGCRKCSAVERGNFLDRFTFWVKKAEVLSIFDGDSWTQWVIFEKTPLCSACVEAFRGVHNDIRDQTWKELPKFFGLPAWESLKDVNLKDKLRVWI